MLAFLPAHPATMDVVWRMALSGAGFGLFQSPNNRTMIAAVPRERVVFRRFSKKGGHGKRLE